jgi:hypothetical protein
MTSHHQQDNLFITYNHPTELKSRKNRRSVSSFASRSYRLTSRKIVLDRSNYRPFIRRDDSATPPLTPVDHSGKRPIRGDKQCTVLAIKSCAYPRPPHPADDCALGSPKADPFVTYPIKVHDYVPFLIDYCESIRRISRLLLVAATCMSSCHSLPASAILLTAQSTLIRRSLTLLLTIVINSLTPRFSPALGVATDRYLLWFNVSLQNAELFHALIALSRVYYDIDAKGFGNTHWTALYHRGEALNGLRHKVEVAKAADDDAAILAALWLMDVDVKPLPRRIVLA